MVFAVWSVFNISSKVVVTANDIAIVIGAAASVLTSIVVIPRIIAEHLFPTNEDEQMILLLKNMQENDTGIRKDSLNSHNDEYKSFV